VKDELRVKSCKCEIIWLAVKFTCFVYMLTLAGDAMSTTSDRQLTKVTSRMTLETTTLTTHNTSSVMSTGLRDNSTTSAYTAALTSTQQKSISSVASTTALKLGRDVTSSSATDTTTNIHLFSVVVKQTTTVPPVLTATSPRSSAPFTTSSDRSKYFTDEYSFSPNRTTSFSAMQTSEVMNNRSSSVTTSPLTVAVLTTTSTVVTSFPLYRPTGNATHSLSFSDKQLANVTSRIGTVVSGSVANYTSITPLDDTATTSYINGTFIH